MQAGQAKRPDGQGSCGSTIKPSYARSLVNQDLAPLSEQSWNAYDLAAFWMADVHSVAGYVLAGSFFSLGLSPWLVLVAMLVGITLVQWFCNLAARPSQTTGTPFPVICRMAFGVRGANVPALTRGFTAMMWYGIQTYLASRSFLVLMLKIFPSWTPYARVEVCSFLGLSGLGWAAFLFLWLIQAALFWQGMGTIRCFLDWAGPVVYIFMIALAIGEGVRTMISSDIDLQLAGEPKEGWAAVEAMLTIVHAVVSYFSAVMLSFGDFARYGRSMKTVKMGNLMGLPINFLGFSLLTAIIVSSSELSFGGLIYDPVELVGKLNSVVVALLGTLTFSLATISINLVANFVAPAFDFSNLAPQHISMRIGGMVVAVGSILLAPWHLYSHPDGVYEKLNTLSTFLGPMFGIMIADYYIVRKQQVDIDELFSTETTGPYWYWHGFNPVALASLVPAALLPALCARVPGLDIMSHFTWFLSAGSATVIYTVLYRLLLPPPPQLSSGGPGASARHILEVSHVPSHANSDMSTRPSTTVDISARILQPAHPRRVELPRPLPSDASLVVSV